MELDFMILLAFLMAAAIMLFGGAYTFRPGAYLGSVIMIAVGGITGLAGLFLAFIVSYGFCFAYAVILAGLWLGAALIAEKKYTC